MNDVEALKEVKRKYESMRTEIAKVVIGQDAVVEELLISIFSRGHCLLVGVPGLAKTLLVNTIARTLGLSFNRVQFTPDLMPSDIIGSEVLGDDRKFKFVKGPLFANMVLADEINRTPPKTQSALLEAMQEKSVTTAGQTFKLPDPFFVLATQNPIEQEGTYPLPEAQLDRFMFNIWVDYPSFAEEVQVVKATTAGIESTVNQIISSAEILAYQDLIRKIPVADNVVEYAVGVVSRSRPGTPAASEITNKYISWGAGPRASQYLIIGAKCHAAMQGKYSPDIENVQAVAMPILRHRLVRNYQAEAEGITIENIIESLLKS